MRLVFLLGAMLLQLQACADQAQTRNQALAGRIAPALANDIASRGRAHYIAGRTAEALSDFDQAIRIRPEDPALRYARGVVLARMGRQEAAIADFDEAIRVKPDHVDALSGRANAHRLRGNREAAARDVDAALAADPSSIAALFNRAVLRLDTGEIDGAAADYDHILRLAPDQPIAHAARGVALWLRGDSDRAQQDIDTAKRLAPQDVNLARDLCRNLMRAGLAPIALRECDRAIELDPNHPATRFNRGITRLLAGAPEAAIDDLTAVLAAAPRMADALQVRCLANRQLRREPAAAADCTAAAAIDPNVATRVERNMPKLRHLP